METNERLIETFSNNFEHIVPDRTDAKVIFSLFLDIKHKQSNTAYYELEVKELIKKHHKHDTATEREQRQKVEERLQVLLRNQFIDRNKDKKLLLSDYSIQLCTLFYEKIQPMLNPSEIERTLEDVKVTLESRCKSVDDILHWYNVQFLSVLKPKLASQIVALEYQIISLKDDLNEQNKLLAFADLIDYVDQQMETVIEDRKKLTKAFNGLDSITDILTETPLNQLSDIEFIKIKSSLRETLDHYKFKLEKAGDEITKIKKIASSLFDKIDKKPFYRKLETFFYQVLENSSSHKKGNRKDKEDTLYFTVDIILPESLKSIGVVKHAPGLFIYPEFHQNLVIAKNQKIEYQAKNTEYLEAAAEKAHKRKEQARKIEFWYQNLKEQLLIADELEYSSFYLEMLNQEQDIELAIKGTEHILRNLRQEKYTIETSSEFSISSDDLNNAIWNIKIKKPFSN